MVKVYNIGNRPCIIVSNNIGNYSSPNVTIIPVTTAEKNIKQPTHCVISLNLKEDSIVLAECITTVGKNMLGDFMGILSEVEMKKIDNCIMATLGFIPVNNPFEQDAEENIEEKLEKKVTKKSKKGIKISNLEDMQKFIEYSNSHTREETMEKYQLPSKTAIDGRLQYYRQKLKNNQEV